MKNFEFTENQTRLASELLELDDNADMQEFFDSLDSVQDRIDMRTVLGVVLAEHLDQTVFAADHCTDAQQFLTDIGIPCRYAPDYQPAIRKGR